MNQKNTIEVDKEQVLTAEESGEKEQALSASSDEKEGMPAERPEKEIDVTPETQAVEGESGDDVVPMDDKSYIRGGILFLIIAFGGFAFWAAFAPLGSAIVSQGEVMVDSYRKSIQHYEGGIVENILVRNGDLVKEGEPLLQLETTQFRSERDGLIKRILSTQAELERLQSEQAFNTQFSFSQRLLDSAKDDSDIQDVLDQQAQLHKARMSAYMQEQQALGSRVEQIQQQIAGMERQVEILDQQIASLQDEQEAFDTLFKEGLGDGQRARELNRQVLQNKNDRARLESEMARLKIQVTEANLQQATRRQDFLKEVGEQLKQMQAQYFELQERFRVAEDRMNRSTVRAPERGIVVGLQVHTLGSVISSGQTILDLVPEKDQFVVEARIMTMDINDIYLGQLADIRFSAFNQRTTKVIEGEVVNISADRLMDESTGMPYYLVRLGVTDQGVSDMDESMKLKPGMPAEVMIKRGERTLFSYLLKPISDSFARSLKEK